MAANDEHAVVRGTDHTGATDVHGLTPHHLRIVPAHLARVTVVWCCSDCSSHPPMM
jgi:hypothetical protein